MNRTFQGMPLLHFNFFKGKGEAALLFLNLIPTENVKLSNMPQRERFLLKH